MAKISGLVAILGMVLAFMSGAASKLLPNEHDTSLLLTSPDHGAIAIPKLLHDMQEMLENVDKLPSCNKLASAALVNSCSQLDHSSTLSSDQGVQALLDKAKSIYSTRLAICELIEVGARIPDVCSPFKPTDALVPQTGIRGFFNRNGPTRPVGEYKLYDEETAKHLETCASALSKEPQWWTSYSNAKQNAIVICQAMRAEVEKDDAIAFYKLMTELTSRSTDAMVLATEDLEFSLSAYRVVKDLVDAFHVSLNNDLEEMRIITAQHWAGVNADIQGLQNDVQSIQQETSEALHKIGTHNKEMERTLLLVQDMQMQSSSIDLAQTAALSTQSDQLDVLTNMTNALKILHDFGMNISNQYIQINNKQNETRIATEYILNTVTQINAEVSQLPTISSMMESLKASALETLFYALLFMIISMLLSYWFLVIFNAILTIPFPGSTLIKRTLAFSGGIVTTFCFGPAMWYLITTRNRWFLAFVLFNSSVALIVLAYFVYKEIKESVSDSDTGLPYDAPRVISIDADIQLDVSQSFNSSIDMPRVPRSLNLDIHLPYANSRSFGIDTHQPEAASQPLSVDPGLPYEAPRPLSVDTPPNGPPDTPVARPRPARLAWNDPKHFYRYFAEREKRLSQV